MSYFKSLPVCLFTLFFVAGFLLVGLDFDVYAEKRNVIKFSTLAPEGSSWMKSLRRFSGKIKKATDGNVVFKFYPAEYRVMKKM